MLFDQVCFCVILANRRVLVLDFLEKAEASSSPCLDKERFDLDSIHIDKGLKDEVWLISEALPLIMWLFMTSCLTILNLCLLITTALLS